MFENRTYSEILNTLWVEMNQLTTTLISTCFGPYCEEYAQVSWPWATWGGYELISKNELVANLYSRPVYYATYVSM